MKFSYKMVAKEKKKNEKQSKVMVIKKDYVGHCLSLHFI